jgi:hypothetical protein
MAISTQFGGAQGGQAGLLLLKEKGPRARVPNEPLGDGQGTAGEKEDGAQPQYH